MTRFTYHFQAFYSGYASCESRTVVYHPLKLTVMASVCMYSVYLNNHTQIKPSVLLFCLYCVNVL